MIVEVNLDDRPAGVVRRREAVDDRRPAQGGSGRLSLITPRTLKLMTVTLRRDRELAKLIPALSVPWPKSPSLRTMKVRTFVPGFVFAIPPVVDADWRR